MAATVGAANKHRQIGFLKEAGVNPNEYEDNLKRIDLVHRGVDYKDKKKRYWVDDEGRDCFAIYARGLNIDGSDSSEYWRWTTGGNGIEEAEVVNVKWLGVRGSIWTMNLSQECQYIVSFKVKMAKPSTMAGKMVQLKLILPNGDCQQTQARLLDNQQWHELEVGRFIMSTQNVGEMKFIMEKEFDNWEKGLVIRCVEIKILP